MAVKRRQVVLCGFALMLCLMFYYMHNGIGRKERVVHVTKHAKITRDLEFPRLYRIPPCDPKINTTINVDVCDLLSAVISDEKRQTYLYLLNYFNNLAVKHNWTYFITAGTLLGSWRHHGFVPYDPDIELFIDYKHRGAILAALDAQHRIILKQMFTDHIRIYDGNRIPGGAKYMDIGGWWKPALECFFFNQNNTHIFRYNNQTEFVWKKIDVFPLKTRPFEGLDLPAPKDTLGHLITLYGETSWCDQGSRGHKPVKCKDMAKYIPFVYRTFIKGNMEELLVLENEFLHLKIVNDSKESITTDMFSLKRL